MSNRLASARSIFEQNIANNRKNGCDKNILGQKSSCSRTVSRRLFASTKLSDSSSSNSGGNDASLSSLNNSSSLTNHLQNHEASHVRRRSSISSSASSVSASVSSQQPAGRRRSSTKSSNHNNKSVQELDQKQAKGQVTSEPLFKPTFARSKNSTVISSNIANKDKHAALEEKLDLSKNKIRIHDAFAKRQAEKKRGSISSLAEHLNKLEIKNLKPRGDNGSVASNGSSLESHRDQIRLPDFRQSSYRSRNSNNGSHHSNKQPNPANSSSKSNNRGRFTTSSRFRGSGNSHSRSPDPTMPDDSISSIGSTESYELVNNNHQRSRTGFLQGSGSSLSPGRGNRSGSSLDDSSNNRLPPSTRRAPPRTTNSGDSHGSGRSNSSSSSRRTSSKTKKGSIKSLAQHFASKSNSSSPIRGDPSWIQPSSVVGDDDDSCSSPHHQQPFKSVPFTKSVIKRHRESLVSKTRRENSNRSLDVSQSSRSSRSGSVRLQSPTPSMDLSRSSRTGTTPPRALRRRSSMSNTSKRRLKEKTAPPPLLDPEELAMRDEIAALQKRIANSQAKLAQVHQGEQHDLKRVEETKQRKLKRVDAEAEAQKNRSSSSIQIVKHLTKEEEKALNAKYLEAKLTIRQLKQDNARIHTSNRKLKLEIISTSSGNRLLEESNAETKQCLQELETHQKEHLLQEQKQLMKLAATYQKYILDTEEAIEKKEPQIARVKTDLRAFEDRIDIVVDCMQRKCKDFALVEELTAMAFDEDGWEEGEDSSDDDMSRASFINAYTSGIDSESEDESPRGVADLLFPTSSHSLHIFY